MQKIYNYIFENSKAGKKMLAVLIDPDKIESEESLLNFLQSCAEIKVDLIFVGGSIILRDGFHEWILKIKQNTSIPVVLFPGSHEQINENADGILLLSLISGRNPELLIGQHVVAAPLLKKSKLEIIPTGYMLVHCGNMTTAAYISQTSPIPFEKDEMASVTALAGEQLGLKVIYADGGSGALQPIREEMIQAINSNISIPLIIGGGIRSLQDAKNAWQNGADIVVIGTAFEKNPELINEFIHR